MSQFSGVRRAEPTDAPVVANLIRDAYSHYVARIGTEPGPLREDYLRVVTERETWIAESDGTTVGVLVLHEEPEHLLLENVAVAPQMQHQGVGRRLIAFAEQRARDAGLAEVRLYTHELMSENIALYTLLGYVETGRRTEHGLSRVFFAKSLGD